MPLFAFFGILSTTLLAGGAAVGVPVIIHLLNRRRYKIVTWAAMRFLLNAQRQNTRRMRVEQLLLLLCRMALVALIVVAMAAVMPWLEPVWAVLPASWFGEATSNFDQRVHHVMVLDASLSMNLKDGDKTNFERARKLAMQKIESCQAGDGFSVLLLKDNSSWLIGEASQDKRKVLAELETARASHGNASVPTALNMVAGKLTEAGQRFPAQVVWFFTDLQKSTWQSVAPPPSEGDANKKDPAEEINKRARVIFVDVGEEDAGNLAVTDLSFAEPFVTTGGAVQVNATVQNFGSAPKKDVRVELLVGKARETLNEPPLAMRVVAEELVSEIKANDRLAMSFRSYKFPKAGTYAVQVKLQSADKLDVDDSRTVVVTVKDKIPVLLVNGKLAPDRFENATEFVRLVLNPFPAGSEPKEAPIRPLVRTQGQFVNMNDDDLQEYDCIFWCDVPQFGTADLRRLDAHARRGGGVVFSMGEKALENLDAYNRLLFKDEHGLLPARLNKKIQAAPEQHFYVMPDDARTSFLDWPLKAFVRAEDQGTLAKARFYHYVQVTPAQGARLVLKYQPEDSAIGKEAKGDPPPIGDPAILEWNPPMGRAEQPAPGTPRGAKRVSAPARYRGKVVLLTSTVNMDWTTWPASPSFGAMMHELTRLAVSGRLREQAAVVGAVLEDFLPGGGAELEYAVHSPANQGDLKPFKTRTQLVEDVNVIRFGDTDYSGIYRVVLTGTGHEIPFAVNVPISSVDQQGSESDLTRLTEDGLKKAYPLWNLQVVKDAGRADLTGGPRNLVAITVEAARGPAIAGFFLYGVFILLFVEVMLAWRFGHYTTVEGVTAPATASLFWPVALAVTALVVFGVLAAALWYAVKTGDLLALWPGFLFRDQVRTWLEGQLGMSEPQPGESSRWEPGIGSWMPSVIPGSQYWWAFGLLLGGGAMVFLTYLAEAPAVQKPYKLILAGLRVCMLILTIWLLLPQFNITFTRDVWPDLIVLIDTSRSMGEPDAYQDAAVLARSQTLSKLIQEQVAKGLPERIRLLKGELEAREKQGEPIDAKANDEILYIKGKIRYWEDQQQVIDSTKWQPTRLQLVQALLSQPDNDWLKDLHLKRKMRIHIYQLDVNGRAVKLSDDKEGPAGEIDDPTEPKQLDRAHVAIGRLEADGKESRLGTALQQVIEQYRGSSLGGVIMFTDGVTTRDKTIGETASEYAALKGVPLFLIGIGDDHDSRDLKLHDLQVEDTVFKGDRVIFECKVTGKGFKDLTVPVVLKVREKDGREKVVDKTDVKVDAKGNTVKLRLKHTPMEVGRKLYIVEVEPPKVEGNEKPLPPANLRLERAIEVVEDKEIKALYVEQMPRYEFRYIKFLLEREGPNEKSKKKSITLKVVLLDSDDDFPANDRSALADFPANLDELNKYDVVIFGDCDPNHRKLGKDRLRNLASFVRGEDEKGKKLAKPGGGFLMIAGPSFSPHAYKDTPLADIMAVESVQGKAPPEPAERKERLRPELTPSGKVHPIFKFSSDETENSRIWQKLAPMFWTSIGYRIKPAAEVLAVHPSEKAVGPVGPNQDTRLPLVVQQFVGSGRSMYFGFDETWRWRLREDEVRFNTFWVQVMRYLSRGRSSRTDLRIEKQMAHHLGEPIKVIVRFPDGASGPDGVRITDKTEVKVAVAYRPQGQDKDNAPDTENQTMTLEKVPGSWGTYQGTLNRTREGKYRFRLMTPDVRKSQPDGEQPSADAVVEVPPGELDQLRMNRQELTLAASATQGGFYTLATADQVVDEIPAVSTISISSGRPPFLIWNHAIVFCLVMLLLTSEWLLRKRKHLL